MLRMSTTGETSSLLECVYTELDLVGGTLLEATDTPLDADDTQKWRDLGDWLLLAARIKADRVFFLNDDPVLVFSSLPSGSDENDVLECYRRTWSLARPRCLFLAVGDEVRVYSLTNPPTTPGIGQKALAPVDIVTKAAEIGERLERFRRGRLESGATFEEGKNSQKEPEVPYPSDYECLLGCSRRGRPGEPEPDEQV